MKSNILFTDVHLTLINYIKVENEPEITKVDGAPTYMTSKNMLADAPEIFTPKAMVKGNPFSLMNIWLAEAESSELNDSTAMALSTVDKDGLPNVRMVLLKEVEDNGLVFYTNFKSAKGQEILNSKKAAIVLHWKSLRRQIRARGTIEIVSASQADEYYNSRPLQSRIGAWASEQSSPLESRSALMKRAAVLTAKNPTGPERPPHWGGIRILPTEIEFWADGAFRLHDRFRWTRETFRSSVWDVKRLNP